MGGTPTPASQLSSCKGFGDEKKIVQVHRLLPLRNSPQFSSTQSVLGMNEKLGVVWIPSSATSGMTSRWSSTSHFASSISLWPSYAM